MWKGFFSKKLASWILIFLFGFSILIFCLFGMIYAAMSPVSLEQSGLRKQYINLIDRVNRFPMDEYYRGNEYERLIEPKYKEIN